MLTIVVTGLVLMRACKQSEMLSSSTNAWKEWELRGVVFLSLALQIALICLGNYRKYLPHAWIRVVTWLAYLLADSVAIYGLGMISNMIEEIKPDKSLSNPHAELSTFWAPFLLLHLGGPDTISAYAIEDNELWLRHLLTLVNQAGFTVYVLVMTWTRPTLLFLAILILLSGCYKYGERVWVLRAASHEYFKDSLTESPPSRKDYDKSEKEWVRKHELGYNVVFHQVTDVDNEDAIMIDFTISEFPCKKLSSGKDSEDQKYKRIAGTLLSASHLADTSERLFADHLFNMEERDSHLSILSGKHCAGDFKVIEIELGLIYDVFFSKAKAIYTRWGFICRLVILFSICVAMVLFSFTDKRPYSKPDLFLTFLLLGAAIFVELYALAHILFSDQAACWLIKNNQLAIFCFVNRIQPLLKRRRWSNSMGQYNLMSFKENDSRWWRFLKRLHVDETAVKFLYQGRENVTDDIQNLITSKIKETEARIAQELQARIAQELQARDAQELQARDARKLPFQMIDRGIHALSTHKLLEFKWSVERLDFDKSILLWHIATELCYYVDNQCSDGIEEVEGNNRRRVKEKSLMGLHLSRYMIYLQFARPSMLPARMGGIRFRDIYKEPSTLVPLPEFANRKQLLDHLRGVSYYHVSEEDQVNFVLHEGCEIAWELEHIPLGLRWTVISDLWVEILMYAANKCKARDHAQHMGGGSELITHVWLLMAHYGLTDHFQKPYDPPTVTAEIIVNPW